MQMQKTSKPLWVNYSFMEIQVKLFSSTRLFMCALFITAGGIGSVSSANAKEAGTVISTVPVQDAARDSTATPNLSGNWQMSWAGPKGKQRQVTMQVKQDGSKLSGNFQAERGSAPLTGSLKGNQVSFSVKTPKRKASFTGTVDGDKMSGTTEQGASWTATRQ